jgi:hypothetical protein
MKGGRSYLWEQHDDYGKVKLETRNWKVSLKVLTYFLVSSFTFYFHPPPPRSLEEC